MRALLGFGLAAALFVACGGSDDTESSSGGGGTAGSGAAGGADASSGGGGAAGSPAGGGTTSGGSGGSTSGGAAGATSGGSAGTGGAAGSASGGAAGNVADAGGTVCGGKTGAQCSSTEYCDFEGHCGATDQTGLCQPRPQNCPDNCPGVCGCDGKFYCNACDAASLGVDVSKEKNCLPDAAITEGGVGSACTQDAECSGGLKCCYPCGIPGCSNLCMQPSKNGQCPMIP